MELGEGVRATCRMLAVSASSPKNLQAGPESSCTTGNVKPDLSSLGSMLQARWKGGTPAGGAEPDPVRAGQIRKFKIVKLDGTSKKIELELAFFFLIDLENFWLPPRDSNPDSLLQRQVS